MTPPPVQQEFRDRVEQATVGTPYVVTDTDSGFDLSLDVVDAQWWGLFDRAGLKEACTHHVTFPRPGRFTVVDVVTSVEWSAGVPSFIQASGFRGRVVGLKKQKIWALDDQGRFGVVADYTFRPQEGRDLLEGVGHQLGLKQRRGRSEAIGLYVGLFALAGAAVSLVVNLILWITGYYG